MPLVDEVAGLTVICQDDASQQLDLDLEFLDPTGQRIGMASTLTARFWMCQQHIIQPLSFLLLFAYHGVSYLFFFYFPSHIRLSTYRMAAPNPPVATIRLVSLQAI